MNEKVKVLIEKAKAELDTTKQKELERHLKSLGLIDESRAEREYHDYYVNSAEVDEKGRYYTKNSPVINVSDEEYKEICKYFPSIPIPEKRILIDYRGSGVKSLYNFGIFFFVIASIAIFFTIIGFLMYLANDMGNSLERANAFIGISMASSLLPVSLGSFFGGVICLGLSAISKTALYKKTLLEKEYKFIEVNKD